MKTIKCGTQILTITNVEFDENSGQAWVDYKDGKGRDFYTSAPSQNRLAVNQAVYDDYMEYLDEQQAENDFDFSEVGNAYGLSSIRQSIMEERV